MSVESAAKKIYGAGKVIASDLGNFGGKVVGGVARTSIEGTKKLINKTGELYVASARKAYEIGRMAHLHTSSRPVFFDERGFEKMGFNTSSHVTVAIPLKLEGRRYRALKSPKVWHLWGSDYPAVFVELEDPNPQFEGEEAIRLTVHGDAKDALGASNVAWRMWMPGRFQIKVDAQGAVVEKPQAEMTAGDVVGWLADTVCSESNGDLTLTHRDLHLALMMISKKSTTLEKRWAILEERLKYNMNVVNKPEEVAGAWLNMIVLDTNNARSFISAFTDGRIEGYQSTLALLDQMPVGSLRVYGSFANLLTEGQRMLPAPADPNSAYRVPARALLGSYQILRYINLVVANDKKVGPEVERLASKVIDNQVKALKVGGAILDARGKGFDEVTRRVKIGTPELVKQVGKRGDAMMRKITGDMAEEINPAVFIKPQIQAPQPQTPPNGSKQP